MPFDRERSSKASHIDLTENPDIMGFLESCAVIRVPTDEEARNFASQYIDPPAYEDEPLPEDVVAIDGSLYESQVHKNALPSTRIGYVKIVSMLIKTTEFAGIRDAATGMVNPFLLAKLRDGSDALAIALPGSNVRYQGRETVREGFRAALENFFRSSATWVDNDPARDLRATLFAVAARRSAGTDLYTGDERILRFHKCPNCLVDGSRDQPIEVQYQDAPQTCPRCDGELFATDCLRIWEAVGEGAPIGEAIGRTMSAVEHLLPMHYARNIAQTSLKTLSGITFFVDGPLAVFGNAAWMHAGILRLYHELNERLTQAGLQPMLMLGLQKTGAVREHVDLIDRFVPKRRLFAISDDYRFKYITPKDVPAKKQDDDIGFGLETYYGQDFVFKTSSSKTFVIAVPYPFRAKKDAWDAAGMPFKEAKLELARYPTLPRVLRLIEHFETDLYTNASIPIALAHQHTAISLMPGGRVLDLLSHRELTK